VAPTKAAVAPKKTDVFLQAGSGAAGPSREKHVTSSAASSIPSRQKEVVVQEHDMMIAFQTSQISSRSPMLPSASEL